MIGDVLGVSGDCGARRVHRMVSIHERVDDADDNL